MQDGLDTAEARRQRRGREQITLDELDAISEHLRCAHAIAHERANLIALRREPFGEARSYFSGRSCDENLHDRTVTTSCTPGLEEPDGWRNRTFRSPRRGRAAILRNS